jgi:heme/copper-type cytochrome/quinol oxidase subunit 2
MAVSWWLPKNYSEHGVELDHLFNWIFWITTIVMLGTFAAMIYFMVRYRFDPAKRKAHYSHGNPKLELLWTIVPAIILTFISLWSTRVWDLYRYGNASDGRKPAKILVIGEQFQWNVIYPGPDGKFGKYLIYPKPTDSLWPKNADGTLFTVSYGKYTDTKGPADMPYDEAVEAINQYISAENPLGKVFDDPDGKDDNFEKSPGRPIYIPKGRPVEVQLSSKDVIHDFFLPNFRVKLDAVPGLRAVLHFVPTITSKEIEDDPANRITFKSLDEFSEAAKRPENQSLLIVLDDKSQPKAANANSAGASFDSKAGEWKYNKFNPETKKAETIIRDHQPLSEDRVAALKAIGVKEITVCRPGYFDLVCEELCGQGHYKMQGQVIVISPAEYAEKFETKPDADADNRHERERIAISRK